MQILTPSGYKSAASLAVGDEVCAFDSVSGAPLVNTVENCELVDHTEWCRWWSAEDVAPPFNWVRVNDSLMLFGEQSIWRNATNVCHAKHLVVGDTIYDDADQPVVITSVELVEDNSRIWYRFDISGDHSYIVDGLTVHNASRFWVGGTGTWDSSTTTPWAASSGGAGGNSVPGSADTVTLDSNSGGGTVTVNFGGTVTIQSLTMGTFGGTFDNSVNNNNFTLSLSGTALSGTGAAVRSYKLGTATYTLSGANAVMTFATSTNLTLTAGSSTITFSGSGQRQFTHSGVTLGTLSIGATSGSGYFKFAFASGAGPTIGTLSVTAPNYLLFTAGVAYTVTNAIAWSGTSGSAIGMATDTIGNTASVALASGSTLTWAVLRDMAFTSGSPTATNSINEGGNSGVTITAPSSGGGGVGVIGS